MGSRFRHGIRTGMILGSCRCRCREKTAADDSRTRLGAGCLVAENNEAVEI